MRKRSIVLPAVLSVIVFAAAGCVDSGGTVEVQPEVTYRFGRCFEVEDGVIMTTEFAGSNGDIHFVSDDFKIKSLPDSVNDMGEISRFTVYAGKIYFLVHEPGSEPMPGFIYSCDMKGKKMTELSNNAGSYSNCYIKDGYLYYDARGGSDYPEYFFEGDDTYYADTDYDRNAAKGIYKVKIDGTDKKLIVPDMFIEEINEDGLICHGDSVVEETNDYIYYSCDFDGGNLTACEYETSLYNEYGATFRSEGIQYTVNGTGDIYIEKADGTVELISSIELDRVKSERLSLYYVKPNKVVYGIFSYDGENQTEKLYSLPKEKE